MVHKNIKWNISKSKGEEYAHKYLIEILSNEKDYCLPLQDLIIHLNNKTKHINFIIKNKKKPFSVYLKSMYGSFTKFLDKHLMYNIISTDKIYIMLMNDYILNSNYKDTDNTFKINEWEFIHANELNDFILI